MSLFVNTYLFLFMSFLTNNYYLNVRIMLQCKTCKKCLDVSGVLVCELTNQTINLIDICPKLLYQFSNHYDFEKVFN